MTITEEHRKAISHERQILPDNTEEYRQGVIERQRESIQVVQRGMGSYKPDRVHREVERKGDRDIRFLEVICGRKK